MAMAYGDGQLIHWSIGPLDHWSIGPLDHWSISASQNIKKVSEPPATALMVAKLCIVNNKNRKITKRICSTSYPAP